MAFKLKLQEPLDQGLRRVALGQIDDICDQSKSATTAQWVHEARKSLKRTRALLRLARSGMAKAEWRHLNDALRDAGRMLSRRRDQDVRRETLIQLSADAEPALAAALDRVLRNDGRRNGADVLVANTTNPERAATIEALQASRDKLAKLEIDANAATLADGLARTHREARKALKAAKALAGDEAFHDLRKMVQLHWRQMQLLSKAWPELFAARIASARALAQTLGREHDLAVLAGWLAGDAGGGSAADRRLIGKACVQAQAGLRQAALSTAELLFAGRPRSFAREAVAYWEAARSEHLDTAEKPPAMLPAATQRPRPLQRSRSARPALRSKRASPEGGGGRGPVQGKRGSRARAKPAGRT